MINIFAPWEKTGVDIMKSFLAAKILVKSERIGLTLCQRVFGNITVDIEEALINTKEYHENPNNHSDTERGSCLCISLVESYLFHCIQLVIFKQHFTPLPIKTINIGEFLSRICSYSFFKMQSTSERQWDTPS